MRFLVAGADRGLNESMSTVTHPADLQSPRNLEGPPRFVEHHYSPAELAELWGLSADSVRRLFVSEPGVLVVESVSGRYRRRRYRTLRIPASVAERVHRRMSVMSSRQ
jgi:hypothetical protein